MLFFVLCHVRSPSDGLLAMYMNVNRGGKKITARCCLQPFEENRKSRQPKDSMRKGVLSFYLGHNIGHLKVEAVIVEK